MIGVIPCAGKAKRFGKCKALIKVKGKRIVSVRQ